MCVFVCDVYSSAVCEASGSGFPLRSIRTYLVCLVSSTQTQSVGQSSLQPQQNLSQPPWCVADTTRGQMSQQSQKPPSKSPCNIVLWLLLGKILFSWTSSFSPVYSNVVREKWKNRKERRLEQLTWLCVEVTVRVHSRMWFHLGLGREPHGRSIDPVSLL